MEVEGALLMLTPLCRFKSALLLGREARRSRSTLTHLLKRRCLSDRGFYEVAQADATAAVKCSTHEHSQGSLEKGRGCPRERNGNEAQLCEEIQEVRQARGRTDSVRVASSLSLRAGPCQFQLLNQLLKLLCDCTHSLLTVQMQCCTLSPQLCCFS